MTFLCPKEVMRSCVSQRSPLRTAEEESGLPLPLFSSPCMEKQHKLTQTHMLTKIIAENKYYLEQVFVT